MFVSFAYFRNYCTVILKAENSQLAKTVSYQTYCNRTVYLLECMNKDQRLQREKEIGKEEETEKRKNEQFSNGKGMERFCTENYFTVSSDYNLLSLLSLLLLWL